FAHLLPASGEKGNTVPSCPSSRESGESETRCHVTASSREKHGPRCLSSRDSGERGNSVPRCSSPRESGEKRNTVPRYRLAPRETRATLPPVPPPRGEGRLGATFPRAPRERGAAARGGTPPRPRRGEAGTTGHVARRLPTGATR